jgi:hypothetical protein
MNTQNDGQGDAAAPEVPVQPAELEGEALDLAVGGATLATTSIIGISTGKEDTRKGTPVGNEHQHKGTILPGTTRSTPG